jgi:hypothetical protein
VTKEGEIVAYTLYRIEKNNSSKYNRLQKGRRCMSPVRAIIRKAPLPFCLKLDPFLHALFPEKH